MYWTYASFSCVFAFSVNVHYQSYITLLNVHFFNKSRTYVNTMLQVVSRRSPDAAEDEGKWRAGDRRWAWSTTSSMADSALGSECVPFPSLATLRLTRASVAIGPSLAFLLRISQKYKTRKLNASTLSITIILLVVCYRAETESGTRRLFTD